jgi:hypothetical protein
LAKREDLRIQIQQKPEAPKNSDFMAGFVGWNGRDILFSLGGKPALSLRQVKAKVFDNVLPNLGLLLRNVVPCLPQERERRRLVPSIHSSQVGPASRSSST